MLIKMIASELVDSEIELVSLVKHGSNRSPFRIMKAEEPVVTWEDTMSLLNQVANRASAAEKTIRKETNEMMIKEISADALGKPVQKDDANIRARETSSLRQKLAGLNRQQLLLWESPQNPLFQKLDNDYSMAIEKCELELAVLTSDEGQMRANSAFFRRGGSSVHSQASVSDSAFSDGQSAIQKAEGLIDLTDNSMGISTDDDSVRNIDLNRFEL